ncbi:hypothetical protein FGB62_94g042 [Gracilaria domingensis]|nr:hypothetical protein FGB62_94g042 [Gracilaria domingensis]
MQFPPVRRAVAAAMQNHYPDPITAHALRGMPTAARRLLSIMCSVCGRSPSDIAALAAFTSAAIRVCPDLTNSIVADLGRGEAPAQMVLKVLIMHGVVVKPISLSPHIGVAVAVKSDEWQGLFVMLRKSLLFGDEQEREKALKTAHYIVQTANMDIVQDAISLMDDSVPLSLSDHVAIGFLNIAAMAIMRGLKGAINFLDRRILSQCPKGFLSFEIDQSSGETDTIRIDIGMVWDQSLSAVSSIVAAGSASKLALNSSYTVESVSANVLNAVVLVPVVCVTLYQAVDYESIESEAFQLQYEEDEDVPEKLMSMSERDLAAAIASFGASMAALVGIVNVSSSCTQIFESALRRRNSTSETNILSSFLERLLEFDRMFNAMQFAYELLQKQSVQKERLHLHGSKKTKRKRELQKGLDLAESVRATVLRALKDPRHPSRSRNETVPDFPLLSLESVICSLISVPDEISVQKGGDVCTSRGSRDIELVRIDKLMARQLCWFLHGEPRELTSKPGVSLASKSSGYDLSELFAVLDQTSEDQDIERRRFHDIFPDLEKDLVEKDDIFMTETPDELADQHLSEEPLGNVEYYAPCKHACVENHSPYIQSSFESMIGTRTCESNGTKTANMIHSPTFAALLLDRTTSYVILARKLRKTSTNRLVLQDAVVLSGMFLCCLNQVLRFVSGCKDHEMMEAVQGRGSIYEAKRRMLDFFQAVGENLLHDLGDICLPELEQLSKDGSLSLGACRTLNTLGWIGQFSVDSLVASKAVETILIASEVGAIPKCFARKFCFKCLTTVYECDGRAMWNEKYVEWIGSDSLTSWLLKQRRGVDIESLDLDLDAEPWIQLPVKHGRRNTVVESLRILQYFNGMNVSSAVDEGCGWVRELSQALRGDTRPCLQSSTMGHDQIQKRPRVRQTQRQYILCDVLLDMLGFRTIIETLMQVAATALRVFEISESLSSDDFSSAHETPIPTVSAALRLFAGLLNLHQRNRTAVREAQRNNPETTDFVIDIEADHTVIGNSVNVLQITRSRIEELLIWYSNPCVDVSRLPLATLDLIQGIVGLTSKIVKQASGLAETLKKEYSASMEGEQRSTPSKRTRKSPGYVKRKRRHVDFERNENLLKSFKLIPKLVSSSENALLSAKKLAKTIGLRTTRSLMSFAPIAVEDDSSFHFGVGLQRGDVASDDMSNSDDPEAIEANEGESEAHSVPNILREKYYDSDSQRVDQTEDGDQPDQRDRDIRQEPDTIKINIRRGTRPRS